MLRRDRGVPRPRLTRALRERFDRRLTVVVGAAGYGKTTALTNAIESNRLDPVGIDIWLAADSNDADPIHLTNGIAEALGLEVSTGGDVSLDPIINEVWHRAPSDVAIVIDDAHLLDSPESLDVLDRLIKELPRNGHLVLGTRTPLQLAIARLRSHGEVVELDETDLSFTDEEIKALVDKQDAAAAVGPDPSELPRHPALADLQLTAGQSAGTDFLWEEILGEIPQSRQHALIRASVIDQIDDGLARQLSEHEFGAEDLIGDLPLVESFANGSFRLHALLRAALDERLDDADRAKATHIAADYEADRNNLGAAVRLLATGGDTGAAIAMARTYVLLPMLHTPLNEIIAVRRAIEALSPAGLLAQLLAAQTLLGADSDRALAQFTKVADQARAEGDHEIEAVALHRSLQIYFTNSMTPPGEALTRIIELESLVPFAAGMGAHVRAVTSRFRGDHEAAIAEIDGFKVLDPVNQMVLEAEHYCDLGRPEDVAIGLTPEDLGRLPQGTEIFISFAMWLRGEATPELALEIVRSMVTQTLSRRFAQTNVSQLAVASVIATTAGHTDLAKQWVEEARAFAALDPAGRMSAFVHLADAAQACVVEGDGAAAELIEQSLQQLPFGTWPERPYLLGLPLLYVLAPETRPTLDSVVLGATMTEALHAARALVSLRETGETKSAAAINWANLTPLRVHVVPSHLVELAAAAASAGNTAAELAIDSIPDAAALLHAARPNATGATRKWLDAHVASLPPEPGNTVAVATFGPLGLLRDDEPVTDNDWAKRARVRELLAYLVEQGSASRTDVAIALWPDLTDDKAAANLRVTLTYLQKVLEPARPKAVAPVFVQVDGDYLVLSDQVRIDRNEFDATVGRAQSHDRAGAPAEARDLYIAACDLYDGDYLSEFDTDWSFATRLRLQTLATNAACRVGELTLARGEPEEALEWAIRARKLNDLNERAGRLMISCLIAADDRAGANAASAQLLGLLKNAGLVPEPDTEQLMTRLNRR